MVAVSIVLSAFDQVSQVRLQVKKEQNNNLKI